MARRDRRVLEALPGQPRAEAVGAQERVEGAARAELAAAQADVDLAGRVLRPRLTAELVDEALQGELHPRPQPLAEGAVEGAGVVRHLAPDGGDRVPRQLGEDGPQRGRERRRQVGHAVRKLQLRPAAAPPHARHFASPHSP